MRTRPHLTLIPVLAMLASLLLASSAQAAGGKQSYIVVLKRSVASPASVAVKHRKQQRAEVEHVFRHTVKGYSAKLDRKAVKALRKDPRVAYVERDRVARIVKRGGKKKPPDGGGAGTSVGSWGLDRIDQLDLPLDGSFSTIERGDGVIAYVLDTGIRISHREFGGRASYGYDAIDGDLSSNDCHGHGTHVAGTIAGETYGVAKDVEVVAVRVLDCSGSGSWSGIVAGLDWAVGHADRRPAVANLSLGGPPSTAMDEAIARATSLGMTVVVAAGNSNTDACGSSPARAPSAITVGATTSSDSRASYSNVGSCVDIFAPGSGIKSAWRTRNTATKTLSGTSMASPHVAGVAALHLDAHESASPAQVDAALEAKASPGRLSGIPGGTPNLLLHTDH